MKKSLIIGLIIGLMTIILLAYLAYSSQKGVDYKRDPLNGKHLPEFEIVDFSGTQRDLSKLNIGKVTLLNIWASWCSVCKQEHDFLMQLQQQGIDIIGVNYRDQKSKAQLMLHAMGNPYLFNLHDINGAMSFEIGGMGTPESVLLDRHGKVLIRFRGALNESVWQKVFAPKLRKAVNE